MRIANQTVARNYTRNLNRNQSLLVKNLNRVQTGRRFDDMSEAPSSAIRAMQVRRNLSRIEGYIDNTKAAQGQLKSAEGNLQQMSDLAKEVHERFVQGMTDSSDADAREALAKNIEALRDEILSLANGRYSDRYLFGGTNTTSTPFTIDEATGKLLYNGFDVSTIDPTSHPALFEDTSYIEIGLGVKFNPDDSQLVDPNSAFKITINGLDFMGYGENNLYQNMTDMINMLRGDVYDKEEAGRLLNKFLDNSNKIALSMTEIGADSQYLDFTLSRLESEQLNLTERQETLEIIDPAEAILDLKMQEYIYNAALQMGQKLLQPTLFNFIS